MKTKNLFQFLGVLCMSFIFASCEPSEPGGGGQAGDDEYGTITDLKVYPKDLRSDEAIVIAADYSKGKKSINAVGAYSCTQNGKVVKEESNLSLNWFNGLEISLQLEAGSYDITVSILETLEGEKTNTLTKSTSFTVRHVDFKGSAWGETMDATESFLNSKSKSYTREENTITYEDNTKVGDSRISKTYVYTYENSALVSVDRTDLISGRVQGDNYVTHHIHICTSALEGEIGERFEPFKYEGAATSGSTLDSEEQAILDLYNQGKLVDDLLHTLDTEGVLGKAVREGRVVLKANGNSKSTLGTLTTKVQDPIATADTINKKIVLYQLHFEKK